MVSDTNNITNLTNKTLKWILNLKQSLKLKTISKRIIKYCSYPFTHLFIYSFITYIHTCIHTYIHTHKQTNKKEEEEKKKEKIIQLDQKTLMKSMNNSDENMLTMLLSARITFYY